MRLKTMTKALSIAMMVALVGCATKTPKAKKTYRLAGVEESQEVNTVTDTRDDTQVQGVANKSWRWDETRRTWLFNGQPFVARTTEGAVWEGKEQAIVVHIDAASSFRAFDNNAGILLMKVFQLSDSKAFSRSAKSTSGLRHLLTAEPIDPANFGGKRLVVVPGKLQRATLNRQDGARYVGIVLGYSNLKQEKIFRLVPIVTLDNDNAAPSSASGKLTKDQVHPATLDIKITLGEDGISKFDVVVVE